MKSTGFSPTLIQAWQEAANPFYIDPETLALFDQHGVMLGAAWAALLGGLPEDVLNEILNKLPGRKIYIGFNPDEWDKIAQNAPQVGT